MSVFNVLWLRDHDDNYDHADHEGQKNNYDHEGNDVSVKVVKVVRVLHIPAVCLSKSSQPKDDGRPQN